MSVFSRGIVNTSCKPDAIRGQMDQKWTLLLQC